MRNNQEKVFQIAGCSKSVLLLLAVMGVLYGIWVWLTPPTLMDDILYRCIWEPDEDAERFVLKSLSDVIHSQWIHFQTCNGRLVPHLVAQLLYCFTSDSVIKALDTVVFVMLMVFCLHLVEPKRKTVFSLFMLWFLIVFVIFASGSALLWQMGAFNYPWVELAVVAFLCYLRHIDGDKLSWKHCILAPLALLAGWTHESLTLPVTLAMALYVVVHRRTVFRSAMFPYMVFFALGSLLNTFSPSTLHRVDEGNISLFTRLFYGVSTMVFTVKVFWVLVVLLIIGWRKQKDVVLAELRSQFYLYVAMLLAFGIVMTCGSTVNRTSFHAEFLASLLTVSMVRRFDMPCLKRGLFVFWGVIVVALMPFIISIMWQNHSNALYIEEQIDSGKLLMIRVPHLNCKGDALSRWVYSRFITEPVCFGPQHTFDTNFETVKSLRAVKGCRPIYFLPKEVADSIDRSPLAFRTMGCNNDSTLFVWQTDAPTPRGVDFLLRHAERSGRPIYNMFFFHEGDTYHVEAERTFALTINGHRYVLIEAPQKHVRLRIKGVRPAA